MKGILKAILTILLILAFAAAINCVCNGATLTFNWADLGLQTRYLSNRVFYVTPISAPFASGNFIITGDRKNYTNDATASCTATGVVSGAYSVELTGPYAASKLTIWVPDTNATLTVSTLITSPTNLPTAGSVACSSAASDIRYLRHTNCAKATGACNAAAAKAEQSAAQAAASVRLAEDNAKKSEAIFMKSMKK